ncbi:hypothetical protein LLG95_07255 [bacterium]|nr:hypothetical protein [bacterium]
MNDYNHDILNLETNVANNGKDQQNSHAYILTMNEEEQVRIFNCAMKYYYGRNTKMYPDYNFPITDCATWVHDIVDENNLIWPNHLINGGMAIGGPLDYTPIPYAIYGIAVGGYHSYDVGTQMIVISYKGTVQTCIYTKNGIVWVGNGCWQGAKWGGGQIGNGISQIGSGIASVGNYVWDGISSLWN